MSPRIFIAIHYLEIGGAERSLLGLLNAIDTSSYDVDLFVYRHTGEFMPLVPQDVRLLEEDSRYASIEAPMTEVLRRGYVDIILARLAAKLACERYKKRTGQTEGSSIFQFVADYTTPLLPSLEKHGEYELAISFLTPHNIVLDKVKAKKKIAWIHTDYSTIQVDRERELKVWGRYDYIASISSDVTTTFLQTFPELKDKIILIENILSPAFVRQQATLEDVSGEMPQNEGETMILTIGRFSPPKRIEGIPHICAEMEKRGINFKWYIIGYGPDEEIQEALNKYDMRHRMILLGKKTNPYPYIKAADIYCQPSIYEGKSVTVREALMLCKPTVITDFPTASSHFTNGTDGLIVPLEEKACAEALADFIENKELQQRFVEYTCTHDYGNEREVEKIYALMK